MSEQVAEFDGPADRMHLRYLSARRTALPGSAEACGRVLLVGEDNPVSSDPEHALFCSPPGCAGERLQRLVMGLPRLHYLALWRVNLCAMAWSMREAKESARAMIAPGAPWRTVVALGSKVGAAMADISDGLHSPFGWWHCAAIQGRIIFLPHPSGRNRAWNDPVSAERAREILCEVEPDIPWGTA